jgi:hypothetical protein
MPRMGLAYPKSTRGSDGARVRTRPTISRTPRSVVPALRARSLARWITGPSAVGSLNGTPTSITSAPASRHLQHQRFGRLERRVAGAEVRDERGAAFTRGVGKRALNPAHRASFSARAFRSPSMVPRSLSPRPLRQRAMVLPRPISAMIAGRAASACAALERREDPFRPGELFEAAASASASVDVGEVSGPVPSSEHRELGAHARGSRGPR